MRKYKTWILLILLVLFIGVFVFSSTLLLYYFMNSRQQAQAYGDLANQVSQIQEQLKNDPDATASTRVTISVMSPDNEGAAPAILPEYTALYLQNQDLVGWLSIPGTKMNYPVMQTPESPDYYLRRNFDKEYIRHGSIYVDEGCDVFTPSDNLTIFGHNMQDGSMFHDLNNYEELDFWSEHRTFRFDTLLEHHTYEIFAVFITSANLGEGFSYHRFIDAADAGEFDAFVAQCKDLALYETGLTPQYGDKLVCLSTCNYRVSNGRLVVAARRVD